MEEQSRNSSTKNSQHKQKNPHTPQTKISELRDLMQGYLNNCNRKKIVKALPGIQLLQSQISDKQKQIAQLKQNHEVSYSQIRSYHQQKKKLTQQLQNLAKKIQITKQQIKKVKIKKSQNKQQMKLNSQTLKKLQSKFEANNKVKHVPKSNCGLPRISGFNFDLHQLASKKRSTINAEHSNTDRNSNATHLEDKQNFFNSLNFQRIKQIQKLIDQATVFSPIIKIQKYIIGRTDQSIIKKVFKNFSIQQYFDKFFQQKKFVKQLLKIQNQ